MNKKVISATVTPLNEDTSLDLKGLENLFNTNIKQGVDGFFLLGSMGEWGSFSDLFKENLVANSCKIINKRAELLVGINATSLALSLENIERYKKYDFDAYVFMLPGATSALDPVKSILTVLDKADREVYYYHCPPVNNRNLSISEFKTIMAHPNLKGIKNSSSNMYLRRELLELKKENNFSTLLFEGQEWSVDEALFVGCDGMVCGMGALAAKMMVSLAKCADKEDWKNAKQWQEKLIKLYHGVYGKNVENAWIGQKFALKELGSISSEFSFAQEMSLLTPERKIEIIDCINELKEDLI